MTPTQTGRRHVYPPDARYYTDIPHDREWMRRAACRQPQHDPEMWFPPTHGRPAQRKTNQAQRICQDCPVQNACLRYALSTDARYGIWGGATAQDRSRLTGRRFYG